MKLSNSVKIFILVLALIAIAIWIETQFVVVEHWEPTSADAVISSGLKSVNLRGYGIEVVSKALFSEGKLITSKTAIQNLPINENAVSFVCADEPLCGENARYPPLTISPSHIKVNQKINAAVAVCLGTNKKYFIVVGMNSSIAEEAANQACKLQ